MQGRMLQLLKYIFAYLDVILNVLLWMWERMPGENHHGRHRLQHLRLRHGMKIRGDQRPPRLAPEPPPEATPRATPSQSKD